MRSFRSIFIALFLAGLGTGWLLYEEEIRKKIGWEKVVEIANENSPEDSPEKKESSRPEPTDSALEKPVKLTEEAEILAIVTQRYPAPVAVPFDEKFPNAASIPRDAFPEQVRTTVPISFVARKGSRIIGASSVKAGGLVCPEEITADNVLRVSSLASPQMFAEVPILKTDFMERTRENYQLSLERAKMRVEAMRAADSSELKSNSRLLRRLREAESVWDEERTPEIEELIGALSQELNQRQFSVSAFHDSGRMRVSSNDHKGIYDVTTLLVEGTDNGFGPYLWRVQCLQNSKEVVGWVGLPGG